MAKEPYSVTYFNKIPLIFQSNGYLKCGSKTVRIFHPTIRISIPSKGRFIDTDEQFVVNPPLTGVAFSVIQYAIISDTAIQPVWKFVNTKNGLIIDSTIKEISGFEILFKLVRDKKIIQRISIKRDQPLIQVLGYRLHKDGDSIPHLPQDFFEHNNETIPKGYLQMTADSLFIEAGNQLDLLIKPLYHKDSILQFRRIDPKTKDTGIWQLSGHILSLTKPKANSTIQIEIAYQGFKKGRILTIVIQPYWHHTKSGIFLLVSIFTVLVILLVNFIINLKRKRFLERRKLAKNNLSIIQSEQNPHMLFNSLAAIESLIASGKPEKAREYLSPLSEIVRSSFTNFKTPLTSLSEDIELMGSYLRIEQLRFGFSYSIEVDPQLDTSIIEFPPMLLQPSIENAVLHGVSPQSKDGHLRIIYQQFENSLVIEVIDNGKSGPTKPKSGHGNGIRITKERIKELMKLYKDIDISHSITFSPNGTTVRFVFNQWIA